MLIPDPGFLAMVYLLYSIFFYKCIEYSFKIYKYIEIFFIKCNKKQDSLLKVPGPKVRFTP